LASALDDRFYELERIFGEEDTRLIAQSHKVAIDFIERTWKYEGFECDFQRVDGYLFLHPTDSEESLAKEAAAARRAGMEVIELPLMPGIQQQAKCLKFYDQAQFHPLKYLRGISKAVSERGGEIYTETHADQIDHEGVTTSDGFRITARHVVVATNTPVNNKYIMHLKQYPYRSYVIGAKIKKGVLPRALWWDTGDFSMDSDMAPYHYVRTQPLDSTHDLLIVGGEDHPTGHIDNSVLEEEDRYALLEYWMRQHFEAEEIVYQWSGQVMEPMD
jgi:glycine/D-amino acid oxidase-like deaminating enzyme